MPIIPLTNGNLREVMLMASNYSPLELSKPTANYPKELFRNTAHPQVQGNLSRPPPQFVLLPFSLRCLFLNKSCPDSDVTSRYGLDLRFMALSLNRRTTQSMTSAAAMGLNSILGKPHISGVHFYKFSLRESESNSHVCL